MPTTEKIKSKVKQAQAAMAGQAGILNTLKAEHEEVAGLMNKVLQAGDAAGDRVDALYAEIRKKLLLHARAEAEVLYDACEQEEEMADLVADARSEHEEVEDLLMKLDSEVVDQAAWLEIFRELHETVSHHVEEEETQFFPACEDAFDDSMLRDLESDYLEAKERLQEEISAGEGTRRDA